MPKVKSRFYLARHRARTSRAQHPLGPWVSPSADLPVLSAGGCWCGLPYNHPWPGKETGAPHPRGDCEVTTSTAEKPQVILTHNKIRKFQRPYRDILLPLCNSGRVRYTIQKDGQHILLYSGKEGESPFKVSASRPPEQGVPYLMRWIDENVEGWSADQAKAKNGEVKPLFKCRYDCDEAFHSPEEINEHYETVHHHAVVGDALVEAMDKRDVEEVADMIEQGDAAGRTVGVSKASDRVQQTEEAYQAWVEAEPKPETAEDWRPYIYRKTGKPSIFEYDAAHPEPLRLRCTKCDFTREGNVRGVHLHEAKHDGTASEHAAAAGKSRADNAAQRKQFKIQAVTYLAEEAGLVVMTKEDAKALRDSGSAKTQAELKATRKELDDLKARLHLMQQAWTDLGD